MLQTLSDLHCRILCVRSQDLDRTWSHPLSNPWWRLYRNTANGVVISHPEGQLRLPAGRVCLVPAWGRFSGVCTGRTRHLYIHFDPLGWDRAWLQRAFPQPFLAAPEPSRDDFLNGLKDPLDAASRLRLQGELLRLLATAVSALTPELRCELEGSQDPLDLATQEIEGFLTNPRTVPQLAAQCGYSPDHFARRFRARFGCSPQRYLQQRRIAIASERLRGTRDSIEEVAASVGFANRFHFSRVFTRFMQVSPATWRRTGPPVIDS